MTTPMILALTFLSLTFAVFQTPLPSPTLAGGLATGENLVAVGGLSLFLGIPVKGIVDIIKGATGATGGKLPVIGVLVGTILAVLVQVASAYPLSMQVFAMCFFAGLMAQLAAMASTTLQTKMEDAREKSEKEG